jgi:hypothetical protein
MAGSSDKRLVRSESNPIVGGTVHGERVRERV